MIVLVILNIFIINGNGENFSIETLQIQKLLDSLGYDVGKLDGKFGKKTSNAIKKFQKNNGLDITGICDDRTKKT